MAKIGFIGVGNMGGALARAAAKGQNDIFLFDTDTQKAQALAKELGGTVLNAEDVCGCDYVFLGVKPQIIFGVLEKLSPIMAEKKPCIVSMAAGVKISQITEILGADAKIIRIMPNLPVAVGAGMVLYTCTGNASADELVGAMKSSGRWSAIDESLIDAASAVSGCSPAFAFMFIDAMAKAGVECGLSRSAALEYAAQATLGSAKMILEGGEPKPLAEAVCSPGGSTIEGVKSLQNDSFEATVETAVCKSYKRTCELGKK